ncbi:diaminopimelate decarboxylase [bacterium]|nr:diaminopimelate decarboxylase [bacterium]
MTPFHCNAEGTWCIASIPLPTIVGEYGTPCYIYAGQALLEAWDAFTSAFDTTPHQICYAVKANSNLALLRRLTALGAGFDIVSGGELYRVLLAGADPQRIVFSGVGKSPEEIRMALTAGIGCFNVESEQELNQIHTIAAQLQRIAPIALRINPDISIASHPYIATGAATHKFGIPLAQAKQIYEETARWPWLSFEGVACHIGSQITELAPLHSALSALCTFIRALPPEVNLTHVNVGGGLGIAYTPETIVPSPQDWVQAICDACAPLDLPIYFEPGRALVADMGVLVTQIRYLKQTPKKSFCIVDAGMNDCIRPALYAAWHTITPACTRTTPPVTYDVVGPICESSDYLGKDRTLSVETGDFLCVWQVGAYGFSMSSQYNSRPRGAEVWVEDGQITCIRRRESVEDLVALEL